MSLAATLGEVKPRATPDHVVAGLKTGFYKDWASDECDKRCPICLDDVRHTFLIIQTSSDPLFHSTKRWIQFLNSMIARTGYTNLASRYVYNILMNRLTIFIYILISNGLRELVLVLFVVNLCKRQPHIAIRDYVHMSNLLLSTASLCPLGLTGQTKPSLIQKEMRLLFQTALGMPIPSRTQATWAVNFPIPRIATTQIRSGILGNVLDDFTGNTRHRLLNTTHIIITNTLAFL